MTFGPNDDVALAEANDEPAAVPLLLARTSPCVAPFPEVPPPPNASVAPASAAKTRATSFRIPSPPLVVSGEKRSRNSVGPTRRGFSYGFQFLIDESISASRQRSTGELRSSVA
jgi:hypothetical protein